MMFQQETAHRDTARLEDYLQAIRRHRILVVLLTLAGLALGYFYSSSRTQNFEAESQVVLYPTPVGSANNGLVTPNLDKEQAVLESTETAIAAAKMLGSDTPPELLLESVSVTFRVNSDVLNVAAIDPDPDTAASISNAFADSYVAAREAAAIAHFATQEAAAIADRQVAVARASELDALGTQLDADRQAILRDQPAGQTRDDAIAALDVRRADARTELGTVRQTINELDETARTARASLTTRTQSAEVIRRANPPQVPSGLPQWALLLAGVIVGLLLGVITAFLMDRLDTTARDDSDVALALGTKVVGSLPTLGHGQRVGPAALVMLNPGHSGKVAAAKEAFRRLRSAVQFLSREHEVRSLIITSASPAEGKSFVAANLAIALAQGGQRTLLVSADLRRPTQEERFSIAERDKGLSSFLGGDEELVALEVESVDNLWIMPAGKLPANPSELLGSARFGELIALLANEVDLVIVDTPPLLSTSDVTAAARYVDGVVVVVDTRATETTDLLRVRADLERSGSRLLGAVMNRRRVRANRWFGKDRYTYYSD